MRHWYTDAWVGRLKEPRFFKRIEEELPWEIGSNVVPKYIGDDMILLLGLSDAKAEELILEENKHGTSLFYSVERWSPTLRPRNRLIWVQCWGIPLEAWDIRHIRKIVAAVGDLIEVDDDVEELRRLDRARVLIRTPWIPLIHHTVTMHVQQETHNVTIVEESQNDAGQRFHQRRNVIGSSKEIDSDDSDVAEMSHATSDTHPPPTRFAVRHTGDGEDDQHEPSSKLSPAKDYHSADIDTQHGETTLNGPKPRRTGDVATQPAATLSNGSRHHLNPSGITRGQGAHFPIEEACTRLEDRKGNMHSAGVESTTLLEAHFGDHRLHAAPNWKEQGCRGMSPTTAGRLDREEGEISEDAANGQMEVDLNNANGSFVPITVARDISAGICGLSNLEAHDIVVGTTGPSIAEGISTHTPPTSPKIFCESPFTHTAASGSVWRVYSRKRGCRKQVAQEEGKEDNMGAANMLANHQNSIGEVITDPTCSKNDTTTVHVEEATSQWEMAKALGVTAVADPDKIIKKIEEMEDRDRKEAEAMGTLNIHP